MTIIDLFENSVQKFPNNNLFWQKNNQTYEGTTYTDAHKRVISFAAGLMHNGLEPGDRVTLLSEGKNDWVIGELAILYNAAISVPLSVKLNEPEEIIFRLQHSGSKMVITSRSQLPKVVRAVEGLSGIELIIVLDEIEAPGNGIKTINRIIEEGNAFLLHRKEELTARYKAIKGNTFANICYTSGTTADPKGIILSHRNYTANTEQAASLFEIPEWYNTLLILPWDHSFAHTCGIYTMMKHGASLASVKSGTTPLETLKNIPLNIKEIKPVFLLSVPALAKNFKRNIEKAIQEKGGVVEKLFYHALNVAYAYNGNGWDRGKKLRFMLKPLYDLYDKILFGKIRENFGGRLKFFIGGGALLDIELQRFFFALKMPMFQGYGLTEAAPVISSNNFEAHKMGTSGRLVANIEVKIVDDRGKELPTGEKGEIIVKGENVMLGYWNNEKTTTETLKNGWLFTGDLGYFDKDKFLYVLGRFKSLLIADDGEKFSPEGIEEAFTEYSPFIDQCMLHNNQRPYTVCLLVPNKEAIKRYLTHHHIPENEKYEASIKIIEQEINKFRKGGEFETMFPHRWLPASIAILTEGFTEENKMMNSTLKIVRPKITEKHAKTIEYLYTPEAKNSTNETNLANMQKILGNGL